MALFTLGINHRTAPLAVREQLAFHAEELRRALGELATSGGVHEAAILSTCNRTELYVQAEAPQAVVATADSGILDRCGPWLNLARETVDRHVPGAQVVRLAE